MSHAPRDVGPFLRLPRGLAPLGSRNFALFWVGHAVSNTGRWIELTGAVWLTYELTGSPVLLGLLGIARAVPAVVLSPLGGVVADRVDQRRLLALTQAVALVASLCLGGLVATGLVELWHVYLQVAIQSGITAFESTVRQALFPRLVPRKQLVESVTLNSTAGRLSAFVGPVIGGLAIARWGEAAPFLLNAATFLMAMAAVAGMRGVVPRTARAGSSLVSELTEGMRHIIGAPVLSGLLKLEVVVGVLQMNPVMITIVGREVLHVGPEGLGGLLSASALGSLVGIGYLIAAGQARRQGRFVILCTFAYAATLVAFAGIQYYAASFAILVVLGFFDVLMTVTRHSILQLAAPSHMRGRVMANMRTVTGGTGPLSQTLSGVLAGAIGPPLAVLSAAAALTIAAAATARTNAAVWRLTRDDTASGLDDPTASAAQPELPTT